MADRCTGQLAGGVWNDHSVRQFNDAGFDDDHESYDENHGIKEQHVVPLPGEEQGQCGDSGCFRRLYIQDPHRGSRKNPTKIVRLKNSLSTIFQEPS